MKCSKISILLIIVAVILLIAGIVLLVIGIRKKSECKEKNDSKYNALHSWHGLTGGEEDPGLGWVL